MKTVNAVEAVPKKLLKGLVRFYQLAVSPHLPAMCRHTPTCSSYAIDAIETYGILKGTYLTLRRIARCHPWGRGGYDPVPHEERTIT